MENALVTGAGGFIGGHLVKRLLDEGFRVRAVDIKPLHAGNGEEGWWQIWADAENIDGPVFGDLRWEINCRTCMDDIDYVYNLACDMGGIGFIEAEKARCMLSVVINTQLLQAALHYHVKRYFFSSSACIYAAAKQNRPGLPALKESDAYPAQPEDGYGWEKLFSERMCRHFWEDHKLETRVARFHNIYGPHGAWTGGREKAPAAICRKVAEAIKNGLRQIDIWGSGNYTRSFTWIEDCVEGIRRIMESDVREPLNLGSSHQVTINGLVGLIEAISDRNASVGVKLQCIYDLTKPQGVPGRNSDNTLIKECLGWEPKTALRYGLERTYKWVKTQIEQGDY